MVSGPSGSGKTTLCRRLADEGEAVYATSATTRAPRPGERDGHDYHFLDRDDFLAKVDEGEFVEFAEVHGNYYGTLKSEVLSHLRQGTDVVMDIDVQGATIIRGTTDAEIQQALAELFVMPPTEEELKARLTGRGTDSDEVIALRLKNAVEEMRHWPNYSHLLISHTREEDYARFKALLSSERMRVCRISKTV